MHYWACHAGLGSEAALLRTAALVTRPFFSAACQRQRWSLAVGGSNFVENPMQSDLSRVLPGKAIPDAANKTFTKARDRAAAPEHHPARPDLELFLGIHQIAVPLIGSAASKTAPASLRDGAGGGRAATPRPPAQPAR